MANRSANGGDDVVAVAAAAIATGVRKVAPVVTVALKAAAAAVVADRLQVTAAAATVAVPLATARSERLALATTGRTL